MRHGTRPRSPVVGPGPGRGCSGPAVRAPRDRVAGGGRRRPGHLPVARARRQGRRFHVYTPPGYEKKPGVRYPVLYLMHGLYENDEAWTGFGRGHHMLDNLIAQGKARPMVVVMPDGNPIPLDCDRPPERVREALLAFEHDLLDE